MPKKKNIIIFVNEFFGAWNTARGGYGFIARKLLPKLLSEHHICFCLGRSKSWFTKSTLTTEDGFSLIKLPKSRFLASRIVNSFDIAISIEATVDYLFTLKNFFEDPCNFLDSRSENKTGLDRNRHSNTSKRTMLLEFKNLRTRATI